MRRFEEIPHTADWSFRAFGRDMPELFENAAFAMFSMQGGAAADVPDARRETLRTVEVTGIDHESLLVNWLSELLYLQESRRETYHRFKIERLSPTTLRARVFGVPAGGIDKAIKAVTYHNLKIRPTPEGLEVVVVVDV